MINPFAEVNWKPGRPEMRRFARSLMIGGAVLAAGCWAVSRLFPAAAHHTGTWLAVFGVIAAAGVGARLLPGVFRPLYFFWYGVSCCIGFVVSNVILAVFFYGLFTPVGLLRQWFGSDPLQLRARKSPSMFRDHPGRPELRRYFRQY